MLANISICIFYGECDLFSIPLLLFKSTTCSWFGEEVVFIRVSSDSFCSLPPLACTASVQLSVIVVKGYKRGKKIKLLVRFWCVNHTIKKNCSRGSLAKGTGQLMATGEWWGVIQGSSYWISSVLVNGQGGRTMKENQHMKRQTEKHSNKQVKRGRNSHEKRKMPVSAVHPNEP